jgi:hypothetical protein
MAAALAMAMAVAAGCLSGTESLSADVSPAGWNAPATMRYDNTDTLAVKSLILTLRHDSSAPSSTGRYVVETASPSGASWRDTLTVGITLDPGRNRPGEACPADGRVIRRRFDEPGLWHLTVAPLQNTVGVWSVGLDIKKIR